MLAGPFLDLSQFFKEQVEFICIFRQIFLFFVSFKTNFTHITPHTPTTQTPHTNDTHEPHTKKQTETCEVGVVVNVEAGVGVCVCFLCVWCVWIVCVVCIIFET